MSWLDCSSRSESPNSDERPRGGIINLLVIHNISLPPKCYNNNYVEQFFHNQLNSDEHEYFRKIEGVKVSSHLFIRRDGSVIQFVPLDKRAWHAGLSCWKGEESCNDFSIGIELEGCDEEPFTDEQYISLVETTKEIKKYCPEITDDRIVGHSDIAPDRKTDPGPCFEWTRYLAELNER